MKSGHVWAKYREGNEVIDHHGPFSDYWSSSNHKFTVMSQSSSPISSRISSDGRTEDVVIGKHSTSLEVQFSSNDSVRTFSTAYICQLMIFV